MRINSYMLHRLFDKTNLTFSFSKDEYPEVEKLVANIKEGRDYSITIKEIRNRRSKDANNYAWVLIGKLAEFYKMEPDEVYKEQIHKMPVYEIVCIKKDAANLLVSKWTSKGMGWLADVEDSKLDGCVNIRLFYGSSTYDSAQMGMLIDNLIYECEKANISLEDKEGILKAKEAW